MPTTPTSQETQEKETAAGPNAPGETALEDGFRRVLVPPEPLALARLRALLLEVGSRGSDALRAGLEGFRSWRALATLCGTEWTSGARRSSAAARRRLERRLRALGAPPVSLLEAGRLPVGSAVHVRGSIRSAASKGGLKSHIWSHSTTNTDNVRVAVEEGHDFFLTNEDDETGETACVIVARGHLVNADELRPGDRVSVFGFTDRIPARGAGRPGPAGRGGLDLALRAGDDLPLLVRLVAPQEGRPGHRSKL